MATADIINEMKTNIAAAYAAIEAKGGTMPTNKNLANLTTAVGSISSSGIEEVSTVAALKAKVTEENVGQIYRFTGSSSDFESNELYGVVGDSGAGYNVLGLGKVTYNTTKYTVTYNYTACGDEAGTPVTIMPLGGIITVNIYTGIGSYANYVMPDTITVSGCQYTWVLSSDKKSGDLTLYNATGNITVTITAIEVADYGSTPTYTGIWNLFGDCNFRNSKNSAAVFDDTEFTDAFLSQYTKTFGKSTTEWTDFITYLTKAAECVRTVSKNITDNDLEYIIVALNEAWNAVDSSFKSSTTTAKEALSDGYILVTPIIDKNTYNLYLWLNPTTPYASLD